MSAPLLAGALHGRDRVVEPVADDAEISRPSRLHARASAADRDNCSNETIWPGAGSAPGRHKLVAGRKQHDLWPPVHGHERMVHAGGEREIARGEPVSRRRAFRRRP